MTLRSCYCARNNLKSQEASAFSVADHARMALSSRGPLGAELDQSPGSNLAPKPLTCYTQKRYQVGTSLAVDAGERGLRRLSRREPRMRQVKT
jgi:hypothetical protein